MDPEHGESVLVRALLDGGSTVCDKALSLVEDARREFRRYSNAFFLVVGAAAIALIIAIGFMVSGYTQTAIATGVSGVVTSGAAAFIGNARSTTEKELSKRINSANRICTAEGRTVA